MREIKFRGRRKNNVTKEYEWLYGLPVYNSDCSIIDKIEIPAKTGGRCVCVDPKTVGQYTGLKDKHGNEIYEGDVLINDVEVEGVVVYDHKSCYYNVTDNYPSTLYNCEMLNTPGDGWMAYDIEVIGNIHENTQTMSDIIKLAQILENYSNDEPLEVIDEKLREYYDITTIENERKIINKDKQQVYAAEAILDIVLRDGTLNDTAKDSLIEAAKELLEEI